jgi:hypothetical protein
MAGQVRQYSVKTSLLDIPALQGSTWRSEDASIVDLVLQPMWCRVSGCMYEENGARVVRGGQVRMSFSSLCGSL